MTIKVEIWSDISCPWCYIGKHRFESGLARFAHRDQVEVIWRSYQLDPDAPRTTDKTLNEVLAEKHGMSLAQATVLNAQLTRRRRTRASTIISSGRATATRSMRTA